MLQGLYKFRFTTERGEGCGVMFATAGGGLYGGDSGSSFVGGFTEADGVISVEVTMSRHYHDPKYVPMFDVDNVVMKFTGDHRGEEVHFEGGSAALPGVRFTTILTPINETDAPPPGVVGPDGIANGLYSIHIRMVPQPSDLVRDQNACDPDGKRRCDDRGKIDPDGVFKAKVRLLEADFKGCRGSSWISHIWQRPVRD